MAQIRSGDGAEDAFINREICIFTLLNVCYRIDRIFSCFEAVTVSSGRGSLCYSKFNVVGIATSFSFI